MTLKNKKILIVVGGGVSAYKALDLIRLLKKNNVNIKTILTKSGKEFVTPLSITTLTKSKVFEDIFKLKSKKTIIIISHNERNLKKCDKIFKFENKTLKQL